MNCSKRVKKTRVPKEPRPLNPTKPNQTQAKSTLKPEVSTGATIDARSLTIVGLFFSAITSTTPPNPTNKVNITTIQIHGRSDGPLQAGSYQVQVPADPSSAAFFQVAAALVPGSCLKVEKQSLNEGRAGALQVLKRAGARVVVSNRQGAPGEEMGDVEVSAGGLKAFSIEAGEIPSLIDELPILAVMATQARGETMITGAAELRVKESDRIAAMTRALKKMGADIQELPDGWCINGPTVLVGGDKDDPVIIETVDDHRIAMAMAVAALVAKGSTMLDDDACVGVSYPHFFQTLEKFLH